MPSPTTPKRNPWACQFCRRLKVRCLPSEHSNICRKCLRSDTQCIFDEQRAAPKRRRVNASALVRSLEARIDELQARVDETRPNVGVGFPTPESLFQQGREEDEGGPDFTPQLLPTLTPWPVSVPITATATASTGPDELSADDISDSTILTSLVQFRQHLTPLFPYVLISPEATPTDLRHINPLLLHTILTVTKPQDLPLQKSFEKGLRSRLLHAIMISNHKSLDLLQSLLVYLAWYHFFSIPKREQSYQLLQMAITMSVDLGLNLPPREALKRSYGLKLDHYHPDDPDQSSEFYSLDARRAWLGVYYLSTSHSSVWGKRENVGYSPYLEECALSLQDSGHESDKSLWGITKIQALGQEHHQLMRDKLSRVDVEATLAKFHAELTEVDSACGTEGCVVLLEMARQHATAHVNLVEGLNPFIPLRTRGGGIGEEPDKSVQLTTCVGAAKAQVEVFLTIPAGRYGYVTAPMWSGLIYAVVLLYRLSLGVKGMEEWDRSVARKEVKLGVVLEVVCYRLQGVVKMRRGGEDLFSVMGLIFESVRETFERLGCLPVEEASVEEGRVHPTSFYHEDTHKPSEEEGDRDDIMAACLVAGEKGPSHHRAEAHYQHKCPAFQWWGWGTPSIVPSTNPLPTPSASTSVSNDFWPSLSESNL